jgi:serine/threonine-protein kinase
MDPSAASLQWPLAEAAPRARVGRYRMEERLGAGGMAVVYRARDEQLRRTVALKVLAPELARDKNFRKRFLQEARAAAAIDHPHVLPVYAADESDGVLYIAMQPVTGGDLGSLVEREGPLSPERAATLLLAAASALDAVHAGGLVHRDVKPSNILLAVPPGMEAGTQAAAPEHAYLSDFGLAKAVAGTRGLTGTGQFLGTPAFAAPEQVTGGPADGRCDQYALAGVAIVLLTGAAPYPQQNMLELLRAQVREPPPSLTARRPNLPAAADAVIARAMAKSPDARYGSCGEFAAALVAALGIAAGEAAADVNADGDPAVGAPTLPPRGHDRGALSTVLTADRIVAGGCAVVLLGVVALVVVLVIAAVMGGSGNPSAASSSGPPPSGLIAKLPGDTAAVGPLRMAFGPGNATLAGCGLRGIDVWHVGAGSRAAPASGPLGRVDTTGGCTLSPDGRLVAFTGGVLGSPACVWNVQSGTRVGCAQDSLGTVSALSSTGLLAASGLYLPGPQTDLWRAATGAQVATLSAPSGQDIDSVAFTADGTGLALVGAKGTVSFWTVGSGQPQPAGSVQLPGGAGGGHALFSADGSRLAIDTGGQAGAPSATVVIDVRTRTVAGSIPWPGIDGMLAISPDGTVVAEENSPETDLVDVATGRVIQRLTDPGGLVPESAAFTTDGRELAIHDNNALYLWRVPG